MEMARIDEILKVVIDAQEPLSLPVLPLGEGGWPEDEDEPDDPVLVG